MSKIVNSLPDAKRDRKAKILKKQKKIDDKNALDRAKAIDEANAKREAEIDARKPKKAKAHVETGEEKMSLQEALSELEHDDDTHWTQGGLPDLTVLTELTGRKVTRGEVPEDIKRPSE